MMGKGVTLCFKGLHELPLFWLTEAVTRHYIVLYIKAIKSECP